MNRKKSIGVVLKKQFPRHQKISLLDQAFGRLEGVPTSLHAIARVSHGSLVEYVVEPQGQVYFLHEMQLIENMHYSAEQDILFFHHVLEMIYYGVPVGAIPDDIYDLLTSIQKNLTHVCTKPSMKKLSIGKLFVLLGADVDGSVENILKEALRFHDILEMISIEIDQTSENALDAWIHQYIQTHPFSHMFKTIHFLNDVRRS